MSAITKKCSLQSLYFNVKTRFGISDIFTFVVLYGIL
jgi:hypothetical protein